MTNRQRNQILLFLNIIGFLGVIIVNALANALPLNGKNTGQLSDQYPNLFVPAGLTFSIWGVIYLLLVIFIIYHIIAIARRDVEGLSAIGRMGGWFFLSSIFNMAWIFAWHYELVPLSLVIMLLLLASLIVIYLRLDVGRADAGNTEKYLVHLPFSVYLGWITIATIANVTALLVDVNWNRFGLSEQFWAILVIIVGIAIALTVLIRRQDIFYCLVVDWALLGIWLKRTADPTPAQGVIIITLIGLVIITIGIVVQIVRRKVYSVGSSWD